MTFADDVDNSYATRFLSSNLKLIIAVTAAAIIFGIFLFFVGEYNIFDERTNFLSPDCYLLNGEQICRNP